MKEEKYKTCQVCNKLTQRYAISQRSELLLCGEYYHEEGVREFKRANALGEFARNF